MWDGNRGGPGAATLCDSASMTSLSMDKSWKSWFLAYRGWYQVLATTGTKIVEHDFMNSKDDDLTNSMNA